MALTVVLAVVAGLGALLGLLRGLRAGLVAVAGTLLAAVLLDLWAEPLAGWVRETLRPERPAAPTFAAVAALFLLAAGTLGYGGAALLPAGRAAGRPWLDRLVGALLGALNGALVGGYLLRYAVAIWADGWAAELAAGSAVGGLLLDWLPWFVLGMAGATGGLILFRVGRGMLGGRATGQASPTGSVAGAPTLAEADRRLSRKIDEVLKK